MKILITGGCGFIGSHTVRNFVTKYPKYKIFNVDNLSYSGNPDNLNDIENAKNYFFYKLNICDKKLLQKLFDEHKFDRVINLAAETHVDRSIKNPVNFVQTNVVGTVNLLECFKNSLRGNFSNKLFYHISTDEVYGSLDDNAFFTESSRYKPNSPYSASKASSDHFVRAYGKTYGLPYIISNCSNNYGPYQYPEKLIPLFINNIINSCPLPVYGDGKHVRDWLYISDHIDAIDLLFNKGNKFETYNIGGQNQKTNIELIHILCDMVSYKIGIDKNETRKLINFIDDRPGHDYRYAVDSSKIKNLFKWNPKVSIQDGLSNTIDWYLNNKDWLNKVINKDYHNFYKKQYIK